MTNKTSSSIPGHASLAEIPEGVAKPSIVVITALPPPVNGNTLITQHVLTWLSKRCDVRVFPITSEEGYGRTLAKLVRAGRALAALAQLVATQRRTIRNFYTVANAGVGMFLTLLLVGVARTLGYRCILQHHSFSYLTQFDWRMWLVDLLLGNDGVHGVSCADMGRRLKYVYSSNRTVFVMPNTFMMPKVSPYRGLRDRGAAGLMTIGHLSNLTVDKGLDLVIDLLAKLRRENFPVRLVLAGPPASREAKQIIDTAMDQYGDAIEYRGAVYGKEKWNFYKDIDIFVFPTRYKIEAQPVVIYEAISFGCPVVAYGRGCIPSMLADQGGYVVNVDEDFVTKASEVIGEWLSNPQAFRSQSDKVWSRAESLQSHAEDGLQLLVDSLR